MKQEDIQIGVTYLVGLAGNLVPVLITENHPSGKGWIGQTVKTGKQITIRSAQRIHRKASDDKQVGDTTKPAAQQSNRKPKATTDTKVIPKHDTGKPMATGGNQDTGKPMSLINAAAHILSQDAPKPMRCKDIVEQAIEQKLWQLGKGLTPASTLYAAIGREIKTKGNESRFIKAERGMFTLKKQGT
ncbi:MAG TPA: hypothetical protein DCM28_06235 [Phycisphaerales bacterium]|nr:hypothetical protein [Phycisphaerales bacterium]